MAGCLRWFKRVGAIVLVSGAVVTLSPRSWAGDCGCGFLSGIFSCPGSCTHCCRPKCPPYCHEFYGYYSTCWRYWPAGWRNCPPGGQAMMAPAASPTEEEKPEAKTMPKLTRVQPSPAAREGVLPHMGVVSFEPALAQEPPALPTVINGGARPVVVSPSTLPAPSGQ
jgi:hypothetical protein